MCLLFCGVRREWDRLVCLQNYYRQQENHNNLSFSGLPNKNSQSVKKEQHSVSSQFESAFRSTCFHVCHERIEKLRAVLNEKSLFVVK